MKKLLVVAIVAVVTFVLSVSAFAVPAGKTVEFEAKGAGKVVFDGKAHADKGYPKAALLRSTRKSGPAPAVTAGSRPAASGSSCSA